MRSIGNQSSPHAFILLLALCLFIALFNKHDAIQNQPDNALKNRASSVPSRCALNFFGLPRSYQQLVLPSLKMNILAPNARYKCDIFVHYYDQHTEAEGRENRGGLVHPDEILSLRLAVEEVFQNETDMPTLLFRNDTNEQFLESRKDDLHRYQNTLDKDGYRLYFPWKTDWVNSSLDNLVRQWHSIESVFRMMEDHGRDSGISYTRVGMFRNDVFYASPIDIRGLDKNTFDHNNTHAIVPSFSKWPVNDRMIYGPYNATRVWSLERFNLIEKRVQMAQCPGWEMHSERFMKAMIFPTIESMGYRIHENKDICFLRTRPDNSLLLEDCMEQNPTKVYDPDNITRIVREFTGKECQGYKVSRFPWSGKNIRMCSINDTFKG